MRVGYVEVASFAPLPPYLGERAPVRVGHDSAPAVHRVRARWRLQVSMPGIQLLLFVSFLTPLCYPFVEVTTSKI